MQQNSGDSDTDASSSDSDKTDAKFLLIGTVIVIAAGLILLNRGTREELNLNQEAHIEKMWDDDTMEDATQLETNETPFIPALPPMKAAPPSS